MVIALRSIHLSLIVVKDLLDIPLTFWYFGVCLLVQFDFGIRLSRAKELFPVIDGRD